MQSQDNPRQTELEGIIRLLTLAASGVRDSLPCPKCGKAGVSVWFTNPAPEEYRTWFACVECGYESRAHDTARPAHYSEDRIHQGYQARDLEILRRAKFPRPEA